MGKEAEGKNREEKQQQRVIEPAWWPTRVRDLTPAGVAEVVRRTRRMAKLMIDAASEEVLITDSEIRRHKSIYVRRELIAAKITAWEWFFGPYWLGMQPRLSLEEVCPVLHLRPEWIRERVRKAKTGGRWVEGYMDGETRVYGRMVGGKLIQPTRFKLPPGYRVAELYHEGDPLPGDNEEITEAEITAASSLEVAPKKLGVSKPPPSLVVALPPPSPERVEAARALRQSFHEGPKAAALSLEEEAALALRLGFDWLGDADAGIVPGDGK